MEVVVNQWKEEENEVEEVSLHRRRGPQHSRTTTSSSSDKDEEINGGRIQDFVESKIAEILNVSRREVKTENSTILPVVDPLIPKDSLLNNLSTNEIKKVQKMNENYQMEREELYLERVFQKSPPHGFYCPNCNACIEKVYIQKGELKINEPIRCTSCFSFLVPIGSWLFPGLVSDEDRALNDQVAKPKPNDAQHHNDPERNKGKDPSKPDGSIEKPRQPNVQVNEDKEKINEPAGPQGHEKGSIDVTIITPDVPVRDPALSESINTLEILKSIVYGGLTESLASLSVVASAASADATTLNIVALAIANLIGGLFALVHNLGELKSEQPKQSENQPDTPPVDRYKELLGHRDHFFLHAFLAILSFIVFGLVPPLVYGFSFRESDDKDFKMAAVAVASLLCITLLSIFKAYIQRPNSYVIYFQTVLSYVATGTVASVLSYLAGDFVKKLIAKLGWFESLSDFSLQGPRMSVLSSSPELGSY